MYSIASHLIRRVLERIGVPSELFQRNTPYSDLTSRDRSGLLFNQPGLAKLVQTIVEDFPWMLTPIAK